jgi:hypothetical protein
MIITSKLCARPALFSRRTGPGGAERGRVTTSQCSQAPFRGVGSPEQAWGSIVLLVIDNLTNTGLDYQRVRLP